MKVERLDDGRFAVEVEERDLFGKERTRVHGKAARDFAEAVMPTIVEAWLVGAFPGQKPSPLE